MFIGVHITGVRMILAQVAVQAWSLRVLMSSDLERYIIDNSIKVSAFYLFHLPQFCVDAPPISSLGSRTEASLTM